MAEGSKPAPADEVSGTRVQKIQKKARSAASSSKSWAGYGWFMSFGTILPLPIFLIGYLVNLTLVGAPLARRIYELGLWASTLGQEPPGKDRLEARTEGGGEKKPLVERIRPYSPPGFIERRGRPVRMPVRVVWFLLCGWWAGAIWILLAWGVLLFPYPLLDLIRNLLAELPSVMTLAYPASTAR
jgi:hypothetical protein